MEQKDTKKENSIVFYSIGPNEADYAAPLLTLEAVELIKERDAFGVALAKNGEACAAICVRISDENEHVLELVSLYTAIKYRRQGLASQLIARILELVMMQTDGAVQYVITRFSKQREGLFSLLESIGFEVQEEDDMICWQIPVEEIRTSALMEKTYHVPGEYQVKNLQSISHGDACKLEHELWKHGIDDLSANEILAARLGYVLFKENGIPVACAIVTEGDVLCLSQFYIGGGGTSSLAILQAVARDLIEQFSGDRIFEIPTLEASSARLVKKLLPGCKPNTIYRAELDMAVVG